MKPVSFPNSSHSMREVLPEPLYPPDLQQTLEFFNANVGIAEDALEDFGVKDFGGVKRDGDAFTGGILVNHVTAALPGE
ncbi:MAG: hypothetical protein WCD43_09580 [Candidatus Acidiferrales bacterium]